MCVTANQSCLRLISVACKRKLWPEWILRRQSTVNSCYIITGQVDRWLNAVHNQSKRQNEPPGAPNRVSAGDPDQPNRPKNGSINRIKTINITCGLESIQPLNWEAAKYWGVTIEVQYVWVFGPLESCKAVIVRYYRLKWDKTNLKALKDKHVSVKGCLAYVQCLFRCLLLLGQDKSNITQSWVSPKGNKRSGVHLTRSAEGWGCHQRDVRWRPCAAPTSTPSTCWSVGSGTGPDSPHTPSAAGNASTTTNNPIHYTDRHGQRHAHKFWLIS